MKNHNYRNSFTMSDVRNFRDSEVERYQSAHRGIEDTHFQRFREAMKYLNLKSSMKVLNICSIIGEAIPYLRDKYSNITLLNAELSKQFIKIAKQEYPTEIFVQTSLHKFPFKTGYFDYVLSLETLEHVPNPLLFLREIYRVLKSGGILVMSLPPKTAEWPLKIYEQFFPHHGEGPHQFLPSKVVKNMTREVGFNLILHKGTLLIPVGPTWLKNLGEHFIGRLQNTPFSELGIRQFYICRKG
jgi:ubiquinone/menaquinone biosynthesis C-methylase UbiE